ncbi:MAG TPA: DUF3228 family protein [Candidatus Krumholzibacteria bacterium]|nr:DUF3228 family protein [Candidatus Krumholzibacteria bacterium]
MENQRREGPSLGWSDFARGRCVPGGSHTWFAGSEAALLERVRRAWDYRRPGQGRTDLEQVVVVPVDPEGFVSSTVLVDEGTVLQAELVRRRPGEEPFVRVLAAGPREPVHHAAVVLYSAAALLENGGRRSGDFDWEVVALVAGPLEHEPMDPLTMARNMLAKPGGTPCTYTAQEFAEAVWHWACRAAALPEPKD